MGPYCYDRVHGWYLLKLLDFTIAYIRGENPKGHYNIWSIFAIARDNNPYIFNQVLNVLSFPSPSMFLSCFCSLFSVIVPGSPWSNDVKGSIAHHWRQKVIFCQVCFSQHLCVIASEGSRILVNMGIFSLQTMQREMWIKIGLIISNIYKRDAEDEVGKIVFSLSYRKQT